MPLTPQGLSDRIEALLHANKFGRESWHGSDDPPLELSYRFETAPAADFPWSNVGGGFAAYTPAHQAAVRAALDIYESVLNVRFVESPTGGDADLSFYRANDLYTDSPSVGGGRGRWRYSGDEWDGHVVLQTGRDPADPANFDLLLHEIGHMLGLKHPGDYDVGGNNPPGPFLPEEEDNDLYTIMSYNTNVETGLESRSLMLYDIAALQQWWGANLGNASGNDVYGRSADGRMQSIWDGDGIDTIRHTTGQADIDLNEGAFSSFNGVVNLSIAYGTVIENAESGGSDDALTGNDADNRLSSGGGNDSVLGATGDDTLLGGNGNDTLRGGTEHDVLRGGNQEDRLYGDAGDDAMFGDAGFDWLEGGDGNDLLNGGGQADNLLGGDGEDSMYGGQGFDRLFGGTGDDLGYAGTGSDGMFGQQGDDTLFGQHGNDRVFGGQGNDRIDGGHDDDVMFGGAGFDTLIGSTGNDTMSGNFNADTFIFADFGGGFGQDTITDFAATNDFERIDLSRVASITDLADLTANHMSQVGADVVIDALGGNTITLLNVTLADLDANDFVF